METSRIIAVVDDDSAVREAISFLLRSFGYDAIAFESAEEFLHSTTVQHASCVITDIKMPGMTGVELQRCLISGGHRLPVIFMTAFPEESVKRHVLSAGAYGFLTKPCEPQYLIECLETALQA